MKNFTKPCKFIWALHNYFFLLFFTLVSQIALVQANQIDIGVFEAISPNNVIEIKMQPDYNITNEVLTNVQYTVRWPQSSVSLTMDYIYPYFISPQGTPVLYNGYYYQIFASEPMANITIAMGEEVLISSFTYSNGTCSYFEIINDSWTLSHNGSVYFEIEGNNRTGKIYNSMAQSVSIGGSVNGGSSIYLCETTGTLTLTNYSGSILKWQKQLGSGSWTDITSTSATYSEIPVSAGVWNYRAVIQKGSCSSANSSLTQVTVTYDWSEWTGNSDANWSTAGNWTNGVPDTCIDVIVPVVGSKGYPLVDGNASCHDLDIDNGASVTISSTGALTVKGTLTNNTGETGLRIKSDVSGTGSLISSTTGVDARVERYLSKKKWHFIGMPVESGVAGVFHLPSGHSDIYLKPHIEETNLFGDYIIPNSTPLELGRGYECWVGDTTYANNETIVFPGTLNTGDYVTNAVGGFYDLAKNGPGYNFICNPYPSALQGSINTWTKTNVDASIWVWQGTKEIMAGGGNYLTWNGTTGSLTNGIIPSMQGFFVKANAANPSLTIPQNSRVHSSQLYYKDSGLPLNTLRLDVEGNGCSDAVFVCFNEQASDGYDYDQDVRKLYGVNEAPQLYTKIPGDILSINVLPVLENARTIEMGFECVVPSSFIIRATGMDGFDEDTEFFLEDLKAEILQDLKVNPVYNFTGGMGDNPDRFLLHFGNPSSLDENVINPVKIYSYDDNICILNSTQDKIHVSICDILGRIIIEKQFNSSGLVQIKTDAERGYYIVKVQAGDYAAQKKIFLK